MSTITKGSYVEFHFDLYTEDNTLVASTRDASSFAYVHGVMETDPPALGDNLEGKSIGFEGNIILSPEDAYGKKLPDEESIKVIPVSDLEGYLPDGMNLDKGLMFQSEFTLPNGKKGEISTTVMDIQGDQVILYLGHPLAGQTVRFAVELIQVRDATEADIRTLMERYGGAPN